MTDGRLYIIIKHNILWVVNWRIVYIGAKDGVRDDKVIATANELGMNIVFSGIRLFMH